ncbi:hypothetical protein BS47DRAFT_1066163 [Hydnum rufescens UP504]|uniref:Uncharacterized protein n=1 Tax=Hydnum rufescens UP504 TaxID=1448309 RepID=A0A9P6AUW5_9AGAM|nr:hypothetical protein BS47DRAFT_1066163 [Hydnum rufescens UP504]
MCSQEYSTISHHLPARMSRSSPIVHGLSIGFCDLLLAQHHFLEKAQSILGSKDVDSERHPLNGPVGPRHRSPSKSSLSIWEFASSGSHRERPGHRTDRIYQLAIPHSKKGNADQLTTSSGIVYLHPNAIESQCTQQYPALYIQTSSRIR